LEYVREAIDLVESFHHFWVVVTEANGTVSGQEINISVPSVIPNVVAFGLHEFPVESKERQE
jgi:hypothetical protein